MSNDSSNQTSLPSTLSAEKERKAPWVGPFSILFVLFIFFASQIIAGLILYRYGMSKGWNTDYISDWLSASIGAQFAFVLMAEALMLAGVYGGLRLLNWSWRTIGLTKPTAKHIVLGVLATVPYYLLYAIIVILVTKFVPAIDVDQKQEIGFANVHGLAALIMTFISLVVLPPLAEEITMRGFLYSGIKTWVPALWAGLLVSVIFGAAHLAEGGEAGPLWIGAIDTFTLSLVLVYLREKTGNLWAGITLHACKNGLAFILLFVVGTS